MKSYIVRFAILLSALALVVGCGTRDRSTDTHNAVDTAGRPDARVSGATIYLYDRGNVTTAIEADTINKFDEIDSTMAYDLNIDLYDTTGVATTHIVGDSGIIREENNTLHLFGHVVVVTSDSTRLETDYLRWNPGANKIQTDAFVKITQKGDVVTGWGMEADRKLTRIKILRQVSGQLQDDEALRK